jgi:chorismate mutase
MTADVVGHETTSQSAADPDAAIQEAAGRETGSQETAGRETGGRETAGRPTAAQAAAAQVLAAQARAAQDTGAEVPLAAAEIRAMRTRIDEIDQAIIDLWQERARLSQQVGKTRMASGGTRLVLSREREIVERFRGALGPDGTQVALLLLRSGRGPL